MLCHFLRPEVRGVHLHVYRQLSKVVTTKQKGDALEIRVAQILRKDGEANVQRNKILIDSNGNRSEIDVTFGRIWKTTYVECKNYDHGPVPLKDVAKFKEILSQNKIPIRNGLFVTTSRFVPRAHHTGVRLVDGQALKVWEQDVERRAWRRRYVWRTGYFLLGASVFVGLGGMLSEEYIPAELGIHRLWDHFPTPVQQFVEDTRVQLPVTVRQFADDTHQLLLELPATVRQFADDTYQLLLEQLKRFQDE